MSSFYKQFFFFRFHQLYQAKSKKPYFVKNELLYVCFFHTLFKFKFIGEDVLWCSHEFDFLTFLLLFQFLLFASSFILSSSSSHTASTIMMIMALFLLLYNSFLNITHLNLVARRRYDIIRTTTNLLNRIKIKLSRIQCLV